MFIVDFFSARPLLVLIAIAVIIVLIKSVRVANQYERSVVFRLGKFNRTAGPGLYFVWPFIEWLTKLDLRTITADVEQQEGIIPDFRLINLWWPNRGWRWMRCVRAH